MKKTILVILLVIVLLLLSIFAYHRGYKDAEYKANHEHLRDNLLIISLAKRAEYYEKEYQDLYNRHYERVEDSVMVCSLTDTTWVPAAYYLEKQ